MDGPEMTQIPADMYSFVLYMISKDIAITSCTSNVASEGSIGWMDNHRDYCHLRNKPKQITFIPSQQMIKIIPKAYL